MSVSRDIVTTLVTRFGLLFFGMAQSIILARYLLPEGRGQLAILFWIPQLAAMIAPVGIQWSLVYYLRKRPESTPRLLQNGLGLALVAGTIGFAVSSLLAFLLRDDLLKGLPMLAILAATGVVPVRVIYRLLRGIFRGLDRIPAANLLHAIRPPATLLGIILVIVLFQAGLSGLALTMLVVEALLVLLVLRVAYRNVPLRPRFERTEILPMLSYGVRIYAYSLVLFVNYRLGVLIVRYFLDFKEVGYYVTAITMAELLWNVPNAFAFVLFPKIAGSDETQRKRLTTAGCRLTVAVVGAACIAAATLVYPAVLILYGRAFLPSVVPMIALLPGILAMSVQQVLGADISGRGFPGRITTAAIVGVILNIALTLWWVPVFGVIGAALAASIAYTVIAGIVLYSFLKISGARFAETLILKRQDIKDVWIRLRRLVGVTR